MKSFKDNDGRTWTISINVDSIKRTRSLLDVDLMEVVEGPLVERLTHDPILLCDVIYCLCKEEADARDISDEQFGRAMAGDVIESATTCLLEDLCDFFPLDKRALLRKAIEKLNDFQASVIKVAHQRLDSPKLNQQLEAELAKLGDWSGDSPASSASIPAN